VNKLEELSIKLDGKIKAQSHFNVNFEETSLRKLIVKDYRHNEIKIDEYRDLYSIGIKVNSGLSFSVNKADKIFLYKTQKNISDLPYKIYVSDESYIFNQNEEFIKFWNSLDFLLKKIGLTESEGVFLYKNYVFFFLAAEKDIISVLDYIVDFLNANESIFKKVRKRNLASKKIPENLRSLIPLLKKYCVPDDSEREQLIEEMDKREKLKLIQLVRPFFGEIRIYLDSFKDRPLSEEAILIGELAELVSELEIKNT